MVAVNPVTKISTVSVLPSVSWRV